MFIANHISVHAIVIHRRSWSRRITRKPSKAPRNSSSSPVGSAENRRPRIEIVIRADAPKDAALTPNASPAPPIPNRAPPSAGPTNLEVLPAAELSPFAHARSPSSTRFGIDAEAASQ